MQKISLTILMIAGIVFLSFTPTGSKKKLLIEKTPMTNQQDSVLRHVVLFKFKDGTSAGKIKEIVDAFSALPSKIPEIAGYEWGVNNSPEGLNKGLTHGFLLTFKSEADRAVYLPHPDHKAFGALLTPHLDDVTVLDYWTKL